MSSFNKVAPVTTPVTEVKGTEVTKEYKNNRSVFINNSKRESLGFLNLSDHFLDEAYDKLVAFINANPTKVSYMSKTNSKGKYIQMNVGSQVFGFLASSPKNFKALEANIASGDLIFNVATADISADNVDSFLANL